MKASLRLLLLCCLLQPLASLAQPYCQPTFTGMGIGAGHFQSFVFGNIINENSGGTPPPSYVNYSNAGSNFITTVAPGVTYPVSFTTAPFTTSVFYAVWVDINHNFIYEPDERLAATPTFAGSTTFTVDLTIPASALKGYTGMRAMCRQSLDVTDPCGTYAEWGEAEDYTIVIDDGTPCIPVYGYGTVDGDYIDGFQFNTINNVGSGGQNGWAYSDYRNDGPNFITSVAPGITYQATIISGPTGDFDQYAVWVDLNHNFNYEPNELLATAMSSSPGVATTTVDIVIPADALTGYTTMRVMCVGFVIPADPCSTYLSGETEDYTLVIDDGAPCIPLYGAQASQGHYISEVQLAGMSYGPVPAPSGYTDATNIGAHLQSGATSTLTVFGGSAASGYLSAWVDWGNGFELIGSLPVGTGFAQVTFDITPDYSYVGYARMRLTHTDAPVGPCDASAFGNAVDFMLSVGRAGWPCLPLQGYGTQLGDGFTDLTIEGNGYTALTEFPYYAWSGTAPYHYVGGGSITISFTAGQYAPETYRLSMDMNDNGNFFDTNEEPLIHTSAVPGEAITMIYQLPPNCIPGQHFVRLRANDDANSPLVDPCDDQPYGQIFDWVVVVEDPNGPCIPFMSLWTTDGDFIDGVQLGTIQNTGTGSAFGAAYQDYTAQTTNLLVGQQDTIIITGGAYAGDTYSAWIDYNNDNDFDDAGEPLGWIGIADPFGTNTLPFTVPPGTTLGNKRMRVRCATIGMSDGCLDHDYGETEDYMVNIETNTGLAQVETAPFLVLPTNDGVQLVSDAAYIGYTFTLFDATGRALGAGRIAGDRTDLQMTAFAKGAYTVVLNNDTERAAKRFVW